MSQEKITGNQEQAGAGSAPKPFDPTDTARIQELNAKFEGSPEKVAIPEGVMKLQGFEGAIAIKGEGNKYITLGIVGGDVWAQEHSAVLNDTIYDERGGSKENPNPTFEVMSSNQISGALKEELISRFGGIDGIKSIISSMEETPAVSLDTVEREARAKEAKEKEFGKIKDTMRWVLVDPSKSEDEIRAWVKGWREAELTDEQYREAAQYVYNEALLSGQSERVRGKNGELVGHTTRTNELRGRTARLVSPAFAQEVNRLYEEEHRKWKERG